MNDARARKLAENEVLTREVNKHVEELAERWSEPGDQIELICECADETCTRRVHLTVSEHNAIRKEAAQFFVASGHVLPEIERQVGAAGDALVVEKVSVGREVAEQAES